MSLFNYTEFTPCWRAFTGFVSLTSKDCKTAVLDFDKTYNATSGSLMLSGRVAFSIYLHQKHTLRLFIGADPASIRERFSALIEPPTVLQQQNLYPAWVRFNSSHLAPSLPPKDDDGDEWTWHPPTNRQASDAKTLAAAVKNAGLTDLVLVGSSRMRTFFYDLILLLSPRENFTAQKSHGHIEHSLPSHNLTLLYHFFDCSRDIPKTTRIIPSYSNSIHSLGEYFKNYSICSFNNKEAGRRQAVIFSTGICEAQLSKGLYFRAKLPHLLEYLFSECRRPGNTSSSLLVVKSEESVDPRHSYVEALNDNRLTLRDSALERGLPYLDSYRITRLFKIFNDSYDGTHFYSLKRKYCGNRASMTVANLMLDFVLGEMSTSTAATAAVGPPPRLPHTDVVALSQRDGTVIALNNKRRSTFYLVLNNTKHAFPNWDTFVAFGKDWSDVISMGADEFNSFPLGDPLPALVTCN